MNPENKAKKAFVKPEVKKHKAIVSVAGSSSDNCLYASNTFIGTYYH